MGVKGLLQVVVTSFISVFITMCLWSWKSRTQARIQDSEGGGGGSYIQKGGGGGFVQEFQERIQIVAGPWANQQAKQIADSRRGGGGVRSPKKPPVSAPGTHPFIRSLPSIVVVDCAINQWAVWGVCLRSGQTCGFKYGLQVRTRQVIQLPSPNGQKCPVTTETRRCRMKFRSCVGVCLPFL